MKKITVLFGVLFVALFGTLDLKANEYLFPEVESKYTFFEFDYNDDVFNLMNIQKGNIFSSASQDWITAFDIRIPINELTENYSAQLDYVDVFLEMDLINEYCTDCPNYQQAFITDLYLFKGTFDANQSYLNPVNSPNLLFHETYASNNQALFIDQNVYLNQHVNIGQQYIYLSVYVQFTLPGAVTFMSSDLIAHTLQFDFNDYTVFDDDYYYTQGFNAGRQQGYTEGYDVGQAEGFVDGFNEGRIFGYNERLQEEGGFDLSWVMLLLSLFTVIFSIQLLPGFTIGLLVGIPLVFGLLFMFLKFIRG